MSQTPDVNPTSQNLPKAVAPTQNPDGSNALPSTTTDQGAELAVAEPTSGWPSDPSPASGKQSDGDGVPGLQEPLDDQVAATPTPDDPPVEAGDI